MKKLITYIAGVVVVVVEGAKGGRGGPPREGHIVDG